jgi:hypothetical protein
LKNLLKIVDYKMLQAKNKKSRRITPNGYPIAIEPPARESHALE